MDTFTAIDFETGFASTFRFWPKPLNIMGCKSLNMKNIAPIGYFVKILLHYVKNIIYL